MAPKKKGDNQEAPAPPPKRAKTEPGGQKPPDAIPATPSETEDVDMVSIGDVGKAFFNYARYNASRKPLVGQALQRYRDGTVAEKRQLLAQWRSDKSCSWTSSHETVNTQETNKSSGCVRGPMNMSGPKFFIVESLRSRQQAFF